MGVSLDCRRTEYNIMDKLGKFNLSTGHNRLLSKSLCSLESTVSCIFTRKGRGILHNRNIHSRSTLKANCAFYLSVQLMNTRFVKLG